MEYGIHTGRETRRTRAMRNFIVMQGVEAPPPAACAPRYSALMFQARIATPVVVLAAVLHQPFVFVALAAILWWNAAFPALNAFDAVYNRTFGARPGAVRLMPAAAPRRFAQGLGGALSLTIGGAWLLGWAPVAIAPLALLGAALVALFSARFCIGAYLFQLIQRARCRLSPRTAHSTAG